MNKIVVLPAIFTKMTPRKDRSWKLEIETRELVGEEVRIMADRLGSEGYWASSPNDDVTAANIPETAADSGLEGKSPSQRLRNSLYVLWEQRGKKGTFIDYYNRQLEEIIETIKSKLE